MFFPSWGAVGRHGTVLGPPVPGRVPLTLTPSLGQTQGPSICRRPGCLCEGHTLIPFQDSVRSWDFTSLSLTKVTGKMAHKLATASFLALLLSLPSQLSGGGEAPLPLLSQAQTSGGPRETHCVADGFFKGSHKNVCISSPTLANADCHSSH